MFRKDIGDEYKIEIPVPETRKNLIEQAHLLGNFGAETTLKQLKQKYTWKKMRDDIEKWIQKCDTCNRHQKRHIIDHPAKTIIVTGLFDRIGIDLVGGLPETSDGFKYIMVITEYLSKYP